MQSIHHWLERISHVAFGFTFLFCVCELMLVMPEPVEAVVRFATVALPAVGAALFGISVHGEFAQSARRSQHMAERLGVLGEHLSAPAPSFAAVSALTESAALAMAGEIDSWQMIYRARPLALPA